MTDGPVYPAVELALIEWLPPRLGCPVVMRLAPNPVLPIARLARMGGRDTFTLDTVRLDMDFFSDSYAAALGLAQELRMLLTFDLPTTVAAGCSFTGGRSFGLQERPWDVTGVVRLGVTVEVYATAV